MNGSPEWTALFLLCPAAFSIYDFSSLLKNGGRVPPLSPKVPCSVTLCQRSLLVRPALSRPGGGEPGWSNNLLIVVSSGHPAQQPLGCLDLVCAPWYQLPPGPAAYEPSSSLCTSACSSPVQLSKVKGHFAGVPHTQRAHRRGVGNHFTETDEFGTKTLYFSSAIQNSLSLINSSTLRLCSQLPPKPASLHPDSKQSSRGNVVSTINEQYLETDPFSDLTLTSRDYRVLSVNIETPELM